MSQFDPPLDSGVRRYVEALHAACIETFESCQGGNGHTILEPTVRFHGGIGEGFLAFAVASQHHFPVTALRRTWVIINDEPTGSYWEMTFLADKT